MLTSAVASVRASAFTLAFTSGRSDDCGSGVDDISSTTGAADPMMTRLGLVPENGAGGVARTLPSTALRACLSANPAVSPDDSALGAPLRAEAAAKRDEGFDAAGMGADK